MKKCSYCAEEIQDDAIKCKHCGEMLFKQNGKLPLESNEEEKTLHEYYPSWWKYFWLFILGVPLLAAYLLGFILILYAVLDKKNTIYKITTRRIITQRGIFSKNYEEISISDIRAINIRQGIFQRLLNCGNISIVSAASLGAGYEAIQWIKNPNSVREEISNLKLSKE